MRAIGYIRVSTGDQAREGGSLDAQDARIRAYAEMAGLDLVDVIRDEAISGTIPIADRPGGSALLDFEVDHVIALKLDRLFRDAADALSQTRSWDKAGIALHLIDVGGATINTSTAMGRMFLTMMAGFAELERNLIAERTATAMAYKKSRREVYAPVPLGFDRDGDRLVENAGEAKLVRCIRQWRAEGDSLHVIAGRLNDQGVFGKRGGAFHASTIRRIVRNDIHAT